MSFSFVKNSATLQSEDETLLIAVYELGKVIQCHHYEKRFGNSRAESMGFKNHGMTELSDLISMIRLYCEQKGWDYFKLEELGMARYVERMRDLAMNGKQEQLKLEFRHSSVELKND